MLERVYAHLLKSSADAARQRLDAFHAEAAKNGRGRCEVPTAALN